MAKNLRKGFKFSQSKNILGNKGYHKMEGVICNKGNRGVVQIISRRSGASGRGNVFDVICNYTITLRDKDGNWIYSAEMRDGEFLHNIVGLTEGEFGSIHKVDVSIFVLKGIWRM